MTDRDVVFRKLDSIREQLERLRRRRAGDLATFLGDPDRQDALAMSLLVAMQDALDIAFHFASDERWGIPPTYAEGFASLAEHGVIDAALAGELAGMAALRNRIAHGYASVDLERIWAEIPGGIAALERFAEALAIRLGAR